MDVTKTEVFSVILNVILHALILWTFLTLFFFYFAAKLSTQALQTEIGSHIDNDFPKTLNSLSETRKAYLRLALRQFPLNNLIEFTKLPDEKVALNNRWTFIVSLIVIAGLSVLFLTVATILKASCDPSVSLTHIITENIFTFLFVGIVEFLFFKYVALKYIPIAPSVITNTIIDRLKYNMTQ